MVVRGGVAAAVVVVGADDDDGETLLQLLPQLPLGPIHPAATRALCEHRVRGRLHHDEVTSPDAVYAARDHHLHSLTLKALAAAAAVEAVQGLDKLDARHWQMFLGDRRVCDRASVGDKVGR